MKIYVIKNTNVKRDCWYTRFGGKKDVPTVLKGDYWKTGDSTTSTLEDAHLFGRLESAEKRAAHMTEKFKLGGEAFGEFYARYPDSCGKKGWAKYAPKFVAVLLEDEE